MCSSLEGNSRNKVTEKTALEEENKKLLEVKEAIKKNREEIKKNKNLSLPKEGKHGSMEAQGI